METFVQQHAGIVMVTFSLLLSLVVTLGTALARVKFKEVDSRLDYKRRRIDDLEDRVSALEGGRQVHDHDISNLSKLLEKYFAQAQRAVEKYADHNDREHAEIKKLIRREMTSAPASPA